MLTRYGVVFRETSHAEGLSGGFSAVYDVLKTMEERGRVCRGFFVAGLAATQFALPAVVDLLRSLRERDRTEADRIDVVQLAATDPANPYGALLRWPVNDTTAPMTRSVGTRVILCNGSLTAYLRRGNPNLLLFLPEEEPQRSRVAEALAIFLAKHGLESSEAGEARGGGLLISTMNGVPAGEHWMARFLLDAGFAAGASGFHLRRGQPLASGAQSASLRG